MFTLLRQMSLAASAGVLSAHGHPSVTPQAGGPSSRTSKQDCLPKHHTCSVPVEPITRTATWPTMSPSTSLSIPASNVLLAFCWKQGKLEEANQCVGCQLLPPGTIYRRCGAQAPALSLGAVGKVALLSWHLQTTACEDSTFFHLAPPASDRSVLHWDSILDLDGIEILPSKAISPLHFFLLSHGKLQEPLGVAALQTGPPQTPLSHAASMAFWDLPQGTLLDLKRFLGLDVGRSESLRESLLSLFKEGLPAATEDELLNLLLKRGQHPGEATLEHFPAEVVDQAFGDTDEAERTKDHLQQNLKKKQKNKAAAWTEEVLKASGSGSGPLPGTKRSAKTAGHTGGKQRPFPQKVSVVDLKDLLPATPGCYPHWDPTANRIRCFFTTPSGFRASTSLSVTLHGEQEACRQVVAWAWRRHLEHTGGAHCPFSDLDA